MISSLLRKPFYSLRRTSQLHVAKAALHIHSVANTMAEPQGCCRGCCPCCCLLHVKLVACVQTQGRTAGNALAQQPKAGQALAVQPTASKAAPIAKPQAAPPKKPNFFARTMAMQPKEGRPAAAPSPGLAPGHTSAPTCGPSPALASAPAPDPTPTPAPAHAPTPASAPVPANTSREQEHQNQMTQQVSSCSHC